MVIHDCEINPNSFRMLKRKKIVDCRKSVISLVEKTTAVGYRRALFPDPVGEDGGDLLLPEANMK